MAGGGASLGIRWTIGDVTDGGFEALRLSIEGAGRVFPGCTRMAVYVNTISIAEAQRRCGALEEEVRAKVDWIDAGASAPAWLAPYLDEGFAQGVAWKLIPLQAFPDLHELALDNDVILWRLPDAIARWLEDDGAILVAEDVRACFGQFAPLCGSQARNLGIRGLPPRFDLRRALEDLLARAPVRLSSELDEQGLQLAALVSAGRSLHVVPVADVTICSPFPPHLPHLGRCGAHFCGLNTRRLGWSLDGRPAEQYVREHWLASREGVARRVQAAPWTDDEPTVGRKHQP
jgi:hypothetical protein